MNILRRIIRDYVHLLVTHIRTHSAHRKRDLSMWRKYLGVAGEWLCAVFDGDGCRCGVAQEADVHRDAGLWRLGLELAIELKNQLFGFDALACSDLLDW